MSVHSAQSLLQVLQKFEQRACCIAFIILATVLFADVVLRSFLGSGLPWSHQVGVYANMVVSLLGLGLASVGDNHLRPRFADHILPISWEPVMVRLQPLVTALAFVLFAILSIELVLESIRLQERSTVLQTLVWPVQCLLPLAFGLAAFRYGLFVVYPTLQQQNTQEEAN